jgi:pimeloyl-ACP methyl ester carboxylesterase
VNEGWRLPDRISTEQGDIAAGVFGSGPPVVLVHGTPSWSYLWRRIVPVLARHYTVYVWDLLTYGDSMPAPDFVPSVEAHSRTLAALLQRWDLDSPILVGHDIGGAVVLRAHLVEGRQVRALALLDAAVLPPWVTPAARHMQEHRDAYATMPSHLFTEIIAAHLRTATLRPLTPDVTRAYLGRFTGRNGQQRWLRQVAHFDERDTGPVLDGLHRITVPVRVLWGAADQWLNPELGARLAAAIPAARFRAVTRAGHFLTEDQPAEVAHELLTFCRASNG